MMAERCKSILLLWIMPPGWDPAEDMGRHGGLMSALGKHHPVIFLSRSESCLFPRFRRPMLTEVEKGVFVIRGAFGLSTSKIGRRGGSLARAVDMRQIRKLLTQSGMKPWLPWMMTSNRSDWEGLISGPFVYDCIDPCLIDDEQVVNAQMTREIEIARNAALVFSTAKTLLERLRGENQRSHLLPNAADSRLLMPAKVDRSKLPDAMRDGVVAGYLGTLDVRVDYLWLYDLARSCPEVTFAIAGRIAVDPSQLRGLLELKNVLLPGRLSHEEGLRWLSRFNVGIIPFRSGRIGDGINPCKLYSYLAMGLPVLGTDIAELRGLEGVLATNDVSAGTSYLNGALAAKKVSISASPPTWDDRAREAIEVLQRAGLVETVAFQ